jgi:hypothetical protein
MVKAKLADRKKRNVAAMALFLRLVSGIVDPLLLLRSPLKGKAPPIKAPTEVA